jgi:microcystin-dependent protein
VGTPYLAEIKITPYTFAPKGWAMCNGQLMPINQNQALFSLLGTQYGGDGRVTFALPNLQGRVPVHTAGLVGNVGTQSGTATVTLTIPQMPTHPHQLSATTVGADSIVPVNNLLATGAATDPLYSTTTNLTPMGASSVSNAGGSQQHENRQPFLALNYIIALQGIFPSQN